MAIHTDMARHADICIRPLATKQKTPMRQIGLVWRPSYQRVSTLTLLAQSFADALTPEII